MPGSPAMQKETPEGAPSGSKSKLGAEHRTANREATGQERASLSAPPGHGKSQSLVTPDWMRALKEIRDFAAKSSEPRIAQLLDSVIRGMKGKQRGAQ